MSEYLDITKEANRQLGKEWERDHSRDYTRAVEPVKESVKIPHVPTIDVPPRREAKVSRIWPATCHGYCRK